LLKNSGCVSGHDFSRAESALFAVGFSPWLSLHSQQSDFFSTRCQSAVFSESSAQAPVVPQTLLPEAKRELFIKA
jgi:hypothetical protein